MTSTQTIEELSAQCAAKYGITREMIDHAERWTETDGDLEGLSEERVREHGAPVRVYRRRRCRRNGG